MTKELSNYECDLSEYDCLEFNDAGMDFVLEAERRTFRWEWNLYMEENGNYDD